ncbi:hypothetical protein BGZ92_011150 [Podila epicladia]|nr:hypothetical protein BGZ92_011150 [Podila epicladia]
MIPSYGIEDPSNGMSFKSGKISRGVSQMFNPADSFTHYYSSAINTSPSQGAPPPYSANSTRSGSISSPTSGPPSPTQSFKGFLGRSINSVTEEEAQFQHQQQQQGAYKMEEYRPSLQWLQQTCRPVFMKELTQLQNVPVPITAATAKHPSQIGGSQTVLVASWKQCQVHILPIDRWGSPQEVLHEIQTLHKLRKCRQIIQLYGYLPNAILPTGQVPALLLQQPSYGSLRQFLDHHFTAIQWPERYKLALDMAQGLKYLLTQRVPCNMHSGNVLIDGEGVAILTGFGNPEAMIAAAPTHMTSQPSPAALMVYMAPEKLSGTGGYSPDWEIFSLGILLWELSSGRMPFDEIVTRAESGPRLAKNMEQLSTAIVKGLREEPIPGTPEIYEQLFKMCWEADGESRPPIEVAEETLQMLVVVEPMDMLMLPGEESSMPVSTVLSDSIDADSLSGRGSNSVRSVSPGPSHTRSFTRPTTLHQAISVSNADMTSWYILSGQDLNGFAIVPTYSHECEITPIQTCLGHFLPSSLSIFKELLDLDADITLVAKRSLYNCLHVLFDRYIPVKNERGSAHLMEVVDILLGTDKLDVNALDVQGYTPLHLLMRNPKISSDDVVEIMKKMIAKGADTSISARDGNVLALAAKYLHFEAAKHILTTDITASEPASIDKAIEACMTMTGRATDKFVNLRAKTRELLKLWTGKAAAARREKVCVKVLQDAGQLDVTGVRFKGKPVKLVPKTQLDCANVYYDANVRKVRDNLFSVYVFQPSMR